MPPPKKSAFAWTSNLKKRLVAETSIDDFASVDLNNNVQPTPTFHDSSSQTHPNRGYESELSNLIDLQTVSRLSDSREVPG